MRIGHRLARDDRATTHVALVARAFGADKIYMTGIDQSVSDTLGNVRRRWGGEFEVEVIEDWKALAKSWKKNGGKIVHLTMYGINIIDHDVIRSLRKEERVLVVVGSEKVPRQVYELADFNVAISNQPHSEIAALAIFLDRVFMGRQFKKIFGGGMLRIVPARKGKNVQVSK